MKIHFENDVQLVPATLEDHPIIQKMWPFYIYDLGRACGNIKDWAWPTDQSFVADDLTLFFTNPNKKTFLIKVGDELAGFTFVDTLEVTQDIDFFISEFFIFAKFQNKGIGTTAAVNLFNRLRGKWGLRIIPENKKALVFWRKTLMVYTNGHFSEASTMTEAIKTIERSSEPRPMIMFIFDSSKQNQMIVENVTVRSAVLSDISFYVELSHKKRLSYEKAQPQFWRYAGLQAEESQAKWFEALLNHHDHMLLTAENDVKIIGFIIGTLRSAPEVYNPGGLTLMIDDFCVDNEASWHLIGYPLIQKSKVTAKLMGATQILVVCGAHDEPKRQFLKNIGLTVASEWYVGDIA